MSANITDLLTQATTNSRPSPTSVSAIRAPGATSLQVLALTGWPTATAVHGITYKINTSGQKIAGTQIDFKGVISGTQINNFTTKAGTDNGNAIGDIVEAAPTAAWANDLQTWGSTHADELGNLLQTPVVTAIGTGSIGTTQLASASVTPTKLATGAAQGSTAAASSTTSSTYALLTDSISTAAAVTIGANGLALVSISALMSVNTTSFTGWMSFAVSGATTTAASDTMACAYQAWNTNTSDTRAATFLVTGLTAGSTTFTLQYHANATLTCTYRRIAVVPL